MTSGQQRGLPSAEEVRTLVERILDGVIESEEADRSDEDARPETPGSAHGPPP